MRAFIVECYNARENRLAAQMKVWAENPAEAMNKARSMAGPGYAFAILWEVPL